MKEVRYFYVPDAANQVELPIEEATHALRVLRLKGGDEIFLPLAYQQRAGAGRGGLNLLHLAQQNGDGGNGDFRVNLGQRVVGKAVFQQGFGVLEALGGGGGFHDHRDQFHAVSLGSGRHTVHRPVGGASLQAGGTRIEAHQSVGVGQAKGPVADGIHPDGRVVPDAGVV